MKATSCTPLGVSASRMTDFWWCVNMLPCFIQFTRLSSWPLSLGHSLHFTCSGKQLTRCCSTKRDGISSDAGVHFTPVHRILASLGCSDVARNRLQSLLQTFQDLVQLIHSHGKTWKKLTASHDAACHRTSFGADLLRRSGCAQR